MKGIALFASTCLIGLCGCIQKEDDFIGPPLPPEPIITDSIIPDPSLQLTDETWVIEKYRIGTLTTPIDVDDTIQFITNHDAIYNSYSTSYSFYPSTSVYILTLNESSWGMISGALTTFQISTGEILSTPFSTLTPGAPKQQIHLWIRRL